MNKIWVGTGFGWVGDPGLWTPSGAAQAGDNLTVAQGTPFLGDGSFGSATASTHIGMIGGLSAPPALLMWNETLSNVRIDNVSGVTGDYTAYAGQVVMVGNVTMNAETAINAASNVPRSGTAMTLWLSNAHLTNQGTLAANPFANLDIEASAGSQITNTGLIAANGGHVTVDANVVGSGTILSQVGYQEGGVVELEGSIGSGQVARLEFGQIQVDHPSSFLATVDMSEGALVLEGLNAASWMTTAGGSVLELLNSSGRVIDKLNMVPHPTEQLYVSAVSDPTRGIGTMIGAGPINTGTVPTTHGVIAHPA